MKKTTIFITLILVATNLFGQINQKYNNSQILFKKRESVVDLDYLNNRESINELVNLIASIKSDTLSSITQINICGYSSPEGDLKINKRLSSKRAKSVADYLVNIANINDSLITVTSYGPNWDGLKELVTSSKMRYANEVINILDSVPEERWGRINANEYVMIDSRNKHLMDLRGGVPYNFMIDNFYPNLRRSSIVTVYSRTRVPIINNTHIDSLLKKEYAKSFVEYPSIGENGDRTICNEMHPTNNEKCILPMLAVKTNLLFNAASLINIEIELPIKERWSVAGEWIFPWWSSCGDKSNINCKRNTIQLLNGNLEGKYWFRDVDTTPIMTGWYMGVYTGGGLYDFERNAKGYQGEFFIAAGVSGGYAHTINKRGNLRMEYSLGIGYLKTNYKYYEEHYGVNNEWCTIRKHNGSYSWFGPTRAKASLVWMLNYKVKGE